MSIPEERYVDITRPGSTTGGVPAEIRELQRRLDAHIGKGGNAHAIATPEEAGFMSQSDKEKLDTVQNGATQNQTDEYLLNLANATGDLPIERVDGLQEEIDRISGDSAAQLREDLANDVAGDLGAHLIAYPSPDGEDWNVADLANPDKGAAMVARAMVCFDTVSAMQQAANLMVGSVVQTASFAVPANTTWEVVGSDPDPHFGVQLAGGLYAKLVVQPEMDIRQAGASGAANEPIGGYLLRLYNSGCRRITVPNSSVQLSSTSLPGAVVLGNNCRIAGGRLTDAQLDGVYHLQAGLTEPLSACPQLSGNVTCKLMHRLADEANGGMNFVVVTKSGDGSGFVFHQYRSDEGDLTSISAGSPWGLLRSIDVQPVHNCVLLKRQFSAQSAAHSLISNIEGAFNPIDSSTYMTNSDGTTSSNFIRATNLPAGEWQEYTLTTTANDRTRRKANVAFYSSAEASDSVTVTVGGVEVFKGPATRRGSTSGVWTVDFELANSAVSDNCVHTIRITNNATNNRPTYLLGVNLYRLDDVPGSGTEFDTWKIWRDALNPFINISGASDYAIYDSDLQKFVGSFHGGESSLSLSFSIDGQRYSDATWAPGSFKLGESLKIEQRTNIVSKLDAYVTTTHHADGVQAFRASMQGEMNCATFYTMLTPTYREFDYVVHPVYMQNGVAGELQNIGRGNDVVQKRTDTDQYVRTVYTQFDVSRNSRGGVYLDNKQGGTVGSISNRKIYYGPIYDNAALVERISFEVQREFGKGKY